MFYLHTSSIDPFSSTQKTSPKQSQYPPYKPQVEVISSCPSSLPLIPPSPHFRQPVRTETDSFILPPLFCHSPAPHLMHFINLCLVSSPHSHSSLKIQLTHYLLQDGFLEPASCALGLTVPHRLSPDYTEEPDYNCPPNSCPTLTARELMVP